MRRAAVLLAAAACVAGASAEGGPPFAGPPDGPGEYWGDHHNDVLVGPGFWRVGFVPWMTRRDAAALSDYVGVDALTRDAIQQAVDTHVESIRRELVGSLSVFDGSPFGTDEDQRRAEAELHRVLAERWAIERDAIEHSIVGLLPEDRADMLDRYTTMRADEERYLRDVSAHPVLVLAGVVPRAERSAVLNELTQQLERELGPAVRAIIDADYIDVEWSDWSTPEEHDRRRNLKVEVRRFVMMWAERFANHFDEATASQFIRAVRLSQFGAIANREPGQRGFADNVRWQARGVYSDLPEMIELLDSVDALMVSQLDRMRELYDRIDVAILTRLKAEEEHGLDHPAVDEAWKRVGGLVDELLSTETSIVDAYVETGIINREIRDDGSPRIRIPQSGYQAHQQQERVLGIPNTLPEPSDADSPQD